MYYSKHSKLIDETFVSPVFSPISPSMQYFQSKGILINGQISCEIVPVTLDFSDRNFGFQDFSIMNLTAVGADSSLLVPTSVSPSKFDVADSLSIINS